MLNYFSLSVGIAVSFSGFISPKAKTFISILLLYLSVERVSNINQQLKFIN